MTLASFLRLARELERLGWAVRSQFQSVWLGDDLSEQNPSALRMIEEFLRRADKCGLEGAKELADHVAQHLAEVDGQ